VQLVDRDWKLLPPVRRTVRCAGQIRLALQAGDVFELHDRKARRRCGQPAMQPFGEVLAVQAVAFEPCENALQIMAPRLAFTMRAGCIEFARGLAFIDVPSQRPAFDGRQVMGAGTGRGQGGQ
jgi:hypothetical protein